MPDQAELILKRPEGERILERPEAKLVLKRPDLLPWGNHGGAVCSPPLAACSPPLPGGLLTAAGYCNLQRAQVGGRPTALSAFSNDLTTFSNLSTSGVLQAANAQVNHTVGNNASIRQGVAVYGHLAVQGTAGVNSVFLQNRLLVHNQGGSSNLR